MYGRPIHRSERDFAAIIADVFDREMRIAVRNRDIAVHTAEAVGYTMRQCMGNVINYITDAYNSDELYPEDIERWVRDNFDDLVNSFLNAIAAAEEEDRRRGGNYGGYYQPINGGRYPSYGRGGLSNMQFVDRQRANEVTDWYARRREYDRNNGVDPYRYTGRQQKQTSGFGLGAGRNAPTDENGNPLFGYGSRSQAEVPIRSGYNNNQRQNDRFTRNLPQDNNDGRSNYERRRDEELARRDDERRARLAAMGSKQVEEDNRRLGNPTTIGDRRTTTTVEPGKPVMTSGTEMNGHYAIVRNTQKNELEVVSTLDNDIVQSHSNNLYTLDRRETILVGNTTVIDSKQMTVKAPTQTFQSAFDIIESDDPKLQTPDNYAHVVEWTEMTVNKVESFGHQFLDAAAKIRSGFSEKSLNNQTKLVNMCITLNDFDEFVRNVIKVQFVNTWNSLSRLVFVDPENPEHDLSVESFDQLMSLYPNSGGVALPKKAEATVAYYMRRGEADYAEKIDYVMDSVIENFLGKNTGIMDVNESERRLNCLAAFDDDIPVILGKSKKPRDLSIMTDEEKKMLASRFSADYLLRNRAKSAIVTNLDVNELMRHKLINVVEASDIATAQVFRHILDENRVYDVYTSDGNSLTYRFTIARSAADPNILIIKRYTR